MEASSITNYCWLNGARCDAAAAAQAIAADPHPDLRGHFAYHTISSDQHRLIRDPLGVNKLFFALDGGAVRSANYLIDLIEQGIDLDRIWSVPSGHSILLRCEDQTYTLARYACWPCNEQPLSEPFDVAPYASHIRERLHSVFESIRDLAVGREVFVTMSGGMDSSTIALLAKEHLGSFTGVTFSVGGANGDTRESEDLRFARRLAAEIDVPLVVVVCTPSDVIDMVDEVLLYGQDWRDFNVHCGLVNAAIARALAAGTQQSPTGKRPLVLTGDAMNEIMSDYSAVTYGGREYYRLPRLSRAQLRPFLLRGLDSGDREVGIYARYGLDVIQPYAICADAYLSLPGGFLDAPSAKERLVEAVMGDRVPAYIRQRPKVRAQAGGSDELRGTLAVLADAEIDSEHLKRRFGELLRAEPMAVHGLVKGGYYRFARTWPKEELA